MIKNLKEKKYDVEYRQKVLYTVYSVFLINKAVKF